MKNSKIIKTLTVILTTVILISNTTSKITLAKEYTLSQKYVKGNKIIYVDYNVAYKTYSLHVCKKNNKNHVYADGELLEKIGKNKYWLNGIVYNADSNSVTYCLLKLKIMKKR